MARTPWPGGPLRGFAFWALIAVELLMSFSFFGYIHVEPLSITTAFLPVLLAGALIGPGSAAAVGAVFGLASMWKASASYVMAADQLFSPLYSGNPLGSMVLSVGTRMLFGLTAGLLYLPARRLRRPWVGVAAVSFLGRTIHSLLVYSAMGLFFPESGYGPGDAFSGFFALPDLLANLATAGMVLLIWGFVHSPGWTRFRRRLELDETMQAGERSRHWVSLAAVSALSLAFALAVTFYFVHRMDYVLEVNGIALTDTGYTDMLHLQVQFLFGILSMMALLVLFLALNRRYVASMAQEGRQDSLTGAMTRRAFFTACGRALRSLERQGEVRGYFIMVDLDCFKAINDTHGHPEGDRALREAARVLREGFPRDSLIGRMGGDEFAVLVCADLSAPELEVALRHLLDRIHRTTWEDRHLTCSIGALPFQTVQAPEELYLAADRLLYEAKARGRDQYVIGPAAPVKAVEVSK